MLFKVIVSTCTSSSDASPLFTILSLHISWFTSGPSFSGFVLGALAVRLDYFHPKRSSDNTAVLTLVSFLRRQAQFSQLFSANSSLTASRYFRLIALASTEVMFTTPLAVFSLVINATSAPIEPWISWENTHYDFSRVGQVPAVLWRSDHLIVAGLTLTKWSSVICAFTFFIFFGFATEARKNYSSAFFKLLLICRLKKPTTTINEKSRYGAIVLCSSRFSPNRCLTVLTSFNSHYSRLPVALHLVP